LLSAAFRSLSELLVAASNELYDKLGLLQDLFLSEVLFLEVAGDVPLNRRVVVSLSTKLVNLVDEGWDRDRVAYNNVKSLGESRDSCACGPAVLRVLVLSFAGGPKVTSVTYEAA
jgi:hypothetical protein